MDSLFGGGDGNSQQQQSSPHHVHKDAYLRESVGGLNFGRRKWCQVDSEHKREQSVCTSGLKKPRAMAASGQGKWNIAPKIGTTMQRQDKIGVMSSRITDKPYLNEGVAMNSMQRKLEERGAPPINEIT